MDHYTIKVAIHQGTAPKVLVKAVPDVLVISCYVPMAFRLIVPWFFEPRQPCAPWPAAQPCAWRSSGHRIMWFSPSDSVPSGAPSTNWYIDVENTWKPTICRFFPWGNYGFSTFMLVCLLAIKHGNGTSTTHGHLDLDDKSIICLTKFSAFWRTAGLDFDVVWRVSGFVLELGTPIIQKVVEPLRPSFDWV